MSSSRGVMGSLQGTYGLPYTSGGRQNLRTLQPCATHACACSQLTMPHIHACMQEAALAAATGESAADGTPGGGWGVHHRGVGVGEGVFAQAPAAGGCTWLPAYGCPVSFHCGRPRSSVWGLYISARALRGLCCEAWQGGVGYRSTLPRLHSGLVAVVYVWGKLSKI